MAGQTLPSLKDYIPKHDCTISVVNLLETLYRMFEETPPLEGPRRYGNMADRTWHDKKHDSIRGLVQGILDVSKAEYDNIDSVLDELCYYIENAFGSKIRLDFGTGHELSFLAFIASLDMLQCWPNENPMSWSQDLMFIWNKYYHLVKSLILTYNLEPAGSHGVWGLDDHFHLIYLWGASEWIDQEDLIRPQELVGKKEYDHYAASNFFAQAISFICHVKTGPFREHSPILNDILTTVRSWKKIQRGLLRMYDDEVLCKFPVVQHFWFGKGFFPWVDSQTGQSLPIFEMSPETIKQAQEEKEARHLTSGVMALGNEPVATSVPWNNNGMANNSQRSSNSPGIRSLMAIPNINSRPGVPSNKSSVCTPGNGTMRPPTLRNVSNFTSMDPAMDRLRRKNNTNKAPDNNHTTMRR